MNLKFKDNITYKLFLRLLIILLLFTICRFLFYIFNTKYFSNISPGEFLSIFFGGTRFDTSAILILNLPFIFLLSIPFRFRENRIYRIICKTIFIVINSLALLTNCIDFIYFKFIFKRSTADFFSLFSMGDDMSNTLPKMIKDFWYVAVIWILMIVLMVYLYNRTTKVSPFLKVKPLKYYFINSLIFIAVIFETIIGIRGGFQLKPISIITASRYCNANNVPLVLNSPFTIIKTLKQNPLEKVKYFKDENELIKLYNPVKNVKNVSHLPNVKHLEKLNIVIIILESFSKEHIGELNIQHSTFNIQHSLTPFLDSLIRESLVFPNAFSNGRKSIEGIPAVLASMPSLMNSPYISSAYAGNKIASIATLLKEEGYSTAFYHGGTNGTMGFDNFSKIAGFDKYYGRTEYHNDKDFDGSWGISDEPFLQYFARSMDNTKQPFLTALFTLSSHHPYIVPAKHKGRFNRGNPLQRTISYSDYALKEFFKTCSKMSWFDNTLFVITADHTSEVINEALNNRLGAYEIPVIFYQHDSRLKGMNPNITQHIDIMPSILDYIGYTKPYFAFGNSIFQDSNITQNTKYKIHRFAINYLSDSYEIIDDNYVLQFDGKKYLGLYQRTKDSCLKHNILNASADSPNDLKLLLEAIIQTYNQRMIENKLTVN